MSFAIETLPLAASPDLRAQAVSDAVLLGVGNVGSAFLDRLAITPLPFRLAGVANSKKMLFDERGIDAAGVQDRLRKEGVACNACDVAGSLLDGRTARVIVDATASEAVARRHAAWLAAGIHVVTANKLAAANGWARNTPRVFYGDAATVGAGLPVLAAIRRLHAAGDVITRIEGILSGSLAHVLHDLHRHGSFSRAVIDACGKGLAEPDPREDLSGADVARKLAILASAAGLPRPGAAPESLIPAFAAAMPLPEFLRSLANHDEAWRVRVDAARKKGRVLRYLARLDRDGTAAIGVHELHGDSPLAQTRGADNCIVIHSRAYAREPLIIRGPGAGADVTATALLMDLADLAARLAWRDPAGARR